MGCVVIGLYVFLYYTLYIHEYHFNEYMVFSLSRLPIMHLKTGAFRLFIAWMNGMVFCPLECLYTFCLSQFWMHIWGTVADRIKTK